MEEDKKPEVSILPTNDEEDMTVENTVLLSPQAIKQEMTFECEESEALGLPAADEEEEDPATPPPAKKRRGRKPGSTNKKKAATPATASKPPPASRRSTRKAAAKVKYTEDLEEDVDEPPVPEEMAEEENNEEGPNDQEDEDSKMDDGMISDLDDDDDLIGEEEELGPVSDLSEGEEDDEQDEFRPKPLSKDDMTNMTPLDVFKHGQRIRQYLLAKKFNRLRYKELVKLGKIDPAVTPEPPRKPLKPLPDDPEEQRKIEQSKVQQGLRDAITVGKMCAEMVEAMLDEKGEERDQAKCKTLLEELAVKPISPRALLYYPKVLGIVRKCLGPPCNSEVQAAAAATLYRLEKLFGTEFSLFEEVFGSMDDLDVLSASFIKKEITEDEE